MLDSRKRLQLTCSCGVNIVTELAHAHKLGMKKLPEFSFPMT
jgi:hypothetical protein